MTPEEEAFRRASARAEVLLDLHTRIIEYSLEHEMTFGELATLVAGLLVCTARQDEIGEALGNIIGKVLDYLPGHSSAVIRLARAQPQGTA